MGLTLTSTDVARVGDTRPLHAQLADHIREAITTRGELNPGDKLPSEGQLATDAGVSRTAVRQALDTLSAEGLINKRSGMPTRVAERPKPRFLSPERYRAELERIDHGNVDDSPSSAFTRDHGVQWGDHEVDATYTDRPATEEEARRLHLPPGEHVIHRLLVKSAREIVVEIQESVIPAVLARDTVAADPRRQPYPGGTIAELCRIGQRPTGVTEEILSRVGNPAERRRLGMLVPAHVLQVVRTFRVGERPVECTTAIGPEGRTVLVYDTAL